MVNNRLKTIAKISLISLAYAAISACSGVDTKPGDNQGGLSVAGRGANSRSMVSSYSGMAGNVVQRRSMSGADDRRVILNRLRLLSLRHEDYTLGPGDLIEISVMGWEFHKDTTAMVHRVAESGVISLPVVGNITVSGLTVEQVKALVEGKLIARGYMQDPRVMVTVAEYRAKKVAVLGAVVDPGTYALRDNVTTLVDILSLAGGVNNTGGYIAHVLLRERESYYVKNDRGVDKLVESYVTTIDLYDLFDRGDSRLNITLQDGDVVNVPEAESYSVIGYVKKPGVFKLKSPTTILEAIAHAGGLDYTQSASEVVTIRRVANRAEQIITADLDAIVKGGKPNIYLEANDTINVPTSSVRYATAKFFEAIGRIFTFSYSLNK